MSSISSLISSLIYVPPHMSAVQALFVYSLIAFLALALLGTLYTLYLLVKYRDRALFCRSNAERPDVPTITEGLAPVLGNLPYLTANSKHTIQTHLELAKKYGPVYRMTIGAPIPSFLTFNGKPVAGEILSINDPRDLEHVLRNPYDYIKGEDFELQNKPLLGHGIFATDAAHWTVQRKIASNIFNVKNFRGYYSPAFQSDALKVRIHLLAAHKLNARIDLQDLLLRSTMDSFIKVSMGVELGGLDFPGSVDAKGRYVLPDVPFAKAFDGLNNLVFKRNLQPLWNLEEWFTGSGKQVKAYEKTIDDFAFGVIAQRRKLRAEDAPTGSAQQPPIQLPSYTDVARLKYTTAVFHETLRLEPNVPINVKTAAKDDQLPTGPKIYKGDQIMFSPWIMGRLERNWGPDALEFKPERWLNEQGDLVKQSHFKWPAFNAGPRLCLGMNMATQEAQVLLAAILSDLHLELVNEDEPEKWAVWSEDPEKRKGRQDQQLTLALRGGIDFKVHLVKDKATE